jgi:hypothetical protein
VVLEERVRAPRRVAFVLSEQRDELHLCRRKGVFVHQEGSHPCSQKSVFVVPSEERVCVPGRVPSVLSKKRVRAIHKSCIHVLGGACSVSQKSCVRVLSGVCSCSQKISIHALRSACSSWSQKSPIRATFSQIAFVLLEERVRVLKPAPWVPEERDCGLGRVPFGTTILFHANEDGDNNSSNEVLVSCPEARRPFSCQVKRRPSSFRGSDDLLLVEAIEDFFEAKTFRQKAPRRARACSREVLRSCSRKSVLVLSECCICAVARAC